MALLNEAELKQVSDAGALTPIIEQAVEKVEQHGYSVRY